LNPDFVVYTIFVSNFIGVAFARSLHYQVPPLTNRPATKRLI
jgi:hypothetical protein